MGKKDNVIVIFFFLNMMHCYQLKYSKEHKRAPQPATSLRRYLR